MGHCRRVVSKDEEQASTYLGLVHLEGGGILLRYL